MSVNFPENSNSHLPSSAPRAIPQPTFQNPSASITTGTAAAPVVKSRPPSPTGRSPSDPTPSAGDRPNDRTFLQVVPKKISFNDAHFHPTNYRQEGWGLARHIADMDSLNIRYTTLMPIPTSVRNINSGQVLMRSVGVSGCCPKYYLPPDFSLRTYIEKEEVVAVCKLYKLVPDTEVDDELADQFERLDQDQRNRLDAMVTGLDIGADDCSNKLLKKLKRNKGVFTGVGEVTVHKEVVSKLVGKGWAHLEKNIKPLIQLLYTCGEIGMPVVIHCDIGSHYAKPGDTPKYLAGLRTLFCHEFARKATIVWAHAGGLGRFVNAPEEHVKMVRELLVANPKLHIDLSWSVVADKVVASDSTLAAWKALIEDFQDRFIFGSDSLAPVTAANWNETYGKYAGLRDALGADIVEKVFITNYERVFVGARQQVRQFESTGLDDAIVRLQNAFEKEVVANLTTPAASETANPPAEIAFMENIRRSSSDDSSSASTSTTSSVNPVTS